MAKRKHEFTRGTRPHVIGDLHGKIERQLRTPVRKFEDEIDLSVVRDNIKTVIAYCPDLDSVPSTVDSMIATLVDRIERIPGDGELQFQRFVPQPVEIDVHREVLSKNGVCIRYTVEPNPGDEEDPEGLKVTLEAVVARGKLVENPETD